MTAQDAIGVRQGWYADPAGSDLLRWWTGAAWTEHLRSRTPDLPAPTIFGHGSVGAATGGQADSVPPSEAGRSPTPWSSDAARTPPAAAAQQYRPWVAPPVADWRTGHAWWLALSPVVGLLAVGVSLAVNGATGSDTVRLPLGVGSLVLVVVLALRDRRALQERGVQRPPSAWWLLLGPVWYLGARLFAARADGARSVGPFVTAIAVHSTAVVVTVVLLLSYVLTADRVSGASMETMIEEGLAEQGVGAVATCPTAVDTAPGSSVTCTVDGAGAAAAGLSSVTLTFTETGPVEVAWN